MKSFIKCLALLSLTNVAFAEVSELSTIKVFDGTTAHCRNLADQVRNNTGAYRYQALEASLKGDHLVIRSKIEFLKCDNANGKFAFSTIPMNSDVLYNINGKEVRVETTESKVRVIKDGVYKIANEEILDGESALTQNIDLSKVLNESEREILAQGGSVKIGLDVFLLKKQIFHVDGIEKFRDQTSFGKYRVQLLLSSDNVKILK
ncbi:MAG: hypothetical protein Fur0010_28650 [Bdellovibrio sp.]